MSAETPLNGRRYPYTDTVEQQDLERIVNAIGHRDWRDCVVGTTTAMAAIASVVIAVAAVRIARNAEDGCSYSMNRLVIRS